MEHVLRCEAEADFAKGKALAKENSCEEAAGVLGELYGRIVENEGDLSSSVAPIAYLYGDVNLKLAVESNNHFVNAEVRKRQKQNGNSVKPSGEPSEESDENEEEEVVPTLEEVEELFHISFECLETSRVIYERLINEEPDLSKRRELNIRLGDVFMRLGDLKFEQGLMVMAIEEYNKCLKIRLVAGDEDSRALAGVYHALALSASSIACENPTDVQSHVDSISNYGKALQVLKTLRNRLLHEAPQSGITEEANEVGGKGKKRAKTAKNWLPSLTAVQIDDLEAANDLILPDTATHHRAETVVTEEIKELDELISELNGKVEDNLFIMTVEGMQEERAALEMKREAHEGLSGAPSSAESLPEQPFSAVQTNTPAEGSTTIGFGSITDSKIGVENIAPIVTSSSVPAQIKVVSNLQPKRKVVLQTPSNNVSI